MLTEFLAAAMWHAHYEILEDTGEFWGEIPGFQGVWAAGKTLEECRDELASTLEDWILVGVALHHPLPEVDGLVLKARTRPERTVHGRGSREGILSPMLTEYLAAAMRLAHYEIMEDSGEFWGEIPGFQGVWAAAPTLEECREELAEVLEDWLLFRVAEHLDLPEVDGLRIVTQTPA